jgi:AhpD family alkylhydroperoxidase
MTDQQLASQRPATVPLVEESRAIGLVAEIFADIKATKGIDFVPAFWRTLATNPQLLQGIWNQLKRVMHPEACGITSRLDSKTREMLALAVSATNGCSYCVNSHTAALKKLGVDDETLGEVLQVTALFNATNSLAEGYQIEPDVLPPVG